MNVRSFLIDMVMTMVLIFVVAVVVTWLYSLIAHGDGSADWGTAVRLAIILGVALPLARIRAGRKAA